MSAPTKSSNRAKVRPLVPKLIDLSEKVLYGDVWERPELSKRDRSLITVAALIAMNRPDQLRSHLIRARANGVTQEELTKLDELMTQRHAEFGMGTVDPHTLSEEIEFLSGRYAYHEEVLRSLRQTPAGQAPPQDNKLLSAARSAKC